MKKTKEELHILIDLLPKNEIPAAARFLEFLMEQHNENHDNDDHSTDKDKGEDSFSSESEKIAADTGWKEYLNGKCKPLDQLIKEQLYVEAK